MFLKIFNVDDAEVYLVNFLHGYNIVCFLFVQDPKVYVETILEVHHKYNALVLTAFNNDAGFVAALDKVLGM